MSEGGGALVSHWRKVGSPQETNLAVRLMLGSGFAWAQRWFAAHPLALPLDTAAQKSEEIQDASLCLTDTDQCPSHWGCHFSSFSPVCLPACAPGTLLRSWTSYFYFQAPSTRAFCLSKFL